MNEVIGKLSSQGFLLFPCNKEKIPVIQGGFKSATNDIIKLEKLFYNENFLIGFATGAMNGVAVIDIDYQKEIPGTGSTDLRSIEELKTEVIENYGELPDTFSVETPSGGRHLYYLIPDGIIIKSGNRFFDKTLSIDIKAEGGYVIAPDGKKYNVYDDVEDLDVQNLKSRCTAIPEWLIKLRQTEKISKTKSLIPVTQLPESEIIEIKSALNHVSADDFDSWINTGLALRSTGDPRCKEIWDEWSQTSDKYKKNKQNEIDKKWNSFNPQKITIASLFFEAKKNGWITTYAPKSTIVLSPIESIPIKKKKIKEPFPQKFMNPPGLVGDIYRYILEKSIKEQPIFALSAALCAVGTMAGRKVQTETGLRTNLYCVNVGPPGCGKESARKVIKDLFQSSGYGDMASVEDLASDASIVTAMKKEEAQIFLLDEIGRFIQTTQNGGKNVHLANVITVLLKLYGTANQIYFGKNYADAEKKVQIMQPNLCLLGTTVPETLYKGLTIENITDGFLSRMLIFETDTPILRKKINFHPLGDPNPQLMSKIKKLLKKPIKLFPNGNIDFLKPDPQVVVLTPGARKMTEDFDGYCCNIQQETPASGAIYTRTDEVAQKIALILAVGIDIDNPIITEIEMAYGIELALYLSQHMQYITENHIADNEYEHKVKKIIQIIQENGRIRLSDLTRKSQNIPSYVRRDILDTLEDSEQIYRTTEGVGVKATMWITAI
jgi:hypothetical protein